MSTRTTDYVAAIEDWRQRIEEPLRRDWLSLVGRFDLHDGSYRRLRTASLSVSRQASSGRT